MVIQTKVKSIYGNGKISINVTPKKVNLTLNRQAYVTQYIRKMMGL